MDTGQRWPAVGHSADIASWQAGREATRRAWAGADPALLIGLRSGPDPERKLAAAGIAATGPPGPVSGGVITALGGPGFRVTTGAASLAVG